MGLIGSALAGGMAGLGDAGGKAMFEMMRQDIEEQKALRIAEAADARGIKNEARLRAQNVTDAQGIDADVEKMRRERGAGLMHAGNNLSAYSTDQLAPTTTDQDLRDRGAAAEKRGLIGMADRYDQKRRNEEQTAGSNRREMASIENTARDDKLQREKFEWEKLRGNDSAGLRKIQTEIAQMELGDKKAAKSLMEKYITEPDQAKRSKYREELETRGVLKRPDLGKEETETETMDLATNTTTKRKVTQNIQAKPVQSEAQAQDQARQALASGRISLDEVNKRLASVGFKPLDAPASNVAQKSVAELRRIASKPRGVSTAEANEAQAVLDDLTKNKDRMKAF